MNLALSLSDLKARSMYMYKGLYNIGTSKLPGMHCNMYSLIKPERSAQICSHIHIMPSVTSFSPLFQFFYNSIPMPIIAIEFIVRLAHTIFCLFSGIVSGLASFGSKVLYLLTIIWFTALPLLSLLSIVNTLSIPLCAVPGLADFSLCLRDHKFDQNGHPLPPLWADFPRLMTAQSSTFEQLLDNSVGDSGLSLDIKKAEMAMSNLVVLVKFSKMTSKDVLGRCSLLILNRQLSLTLIHAL